MGREITITIPLPRWLFRLLARHSVYRNQVAILRWLEQIGHKVIYDSKSIQGRP